MGTLLHVPSEKLQNASVNSVTSLRLFICLPTCLPSYQFVQLENSLTEFYEICYVNKIKNEQYQRTLCMKTFMHFCTNLNVSSQIFIEMKIVQQKICQGNTTRILCSCMLYVNIVRSLQFRR